MSRFSEEYKEALKIKRMEEYHQKVKRADIYIACEDLDFIWDINDVLQIDELWKRGKSLEYITNFAERDADEVFLLLLDRIRNGFIQERKGGIFGAE
jgi:hypothetical protein